LLDSLLQEISNMTSTEKFCLRWNDFEKNISRAFRELREDKDFFDVTIACDDDQVEAHKVILSACSPFFRTILKKNKHQHPFVYLKGVRYTDLLSVLNFMYHGEVNVAQDDLNTFLSVAEDLKVKGLTQSSSSSNNSYQTSPPRQLTTVNQQTKRNNQEPTLASAPPQAPAYQHNSYHEEDDIQEVTPVIKAEPTLQIYNPASAPIAKQDTNDTHALAATDDYIDYEAYGNSGYEDSIQIPGETETNKDGILDSLIEEKMARVLDENSQYVWQCQVCWKSWMKKSKCSRHVETHISGADIKCPYCESTYKNRPSLKCHIYAAHKNVAGLIIVDY